MTYAELTAQIVRNAQTVKLKPKRRATATRSAALAKHTRARTSGAAKLVAPTLLAPIASALRTALVWQIAQRHGIALEEAELRLDAGEDVRPYLPALPDAAHARAARSEGRATRGPKRLAGDEAGRRHNAPANARYLARLGLRLLDPGRFTQAWSKGGGAAVPAAFEPIVAAVVETYADSPPNTQRSQVTCVRAFVAGCWRAGWETPYEVPTDREDIVSGLQRVAMGKDSYIQLACNVYGRAVHRLNGRGQTPPYPVIGRRVDARERGLRSLPACAFDGTVVDPTHESAETLLARIAPRIAETWVAYSTTSRGAKEKRKMREQRLAQLGRLVATLARRRDLLLHARSSTGGPVPSAVADVELSDLYELEVPVSHARRTYTSASPAAPASGLAARLASRRTEAVAAGEFIPLIRALVEDEVRASRESDGSGRRQATVPVPPSVRSTFESATKILRDVLGDAARAHPELELTLAPARARIDAVHHALIAHIETVNRGAVARGEATESTLRKDLLAQVLTLPWLVCIGLPRLACEARALEATYIATRLDVAAKGHGDPDRRPQVVEAKRAWYSALEHYVVLAAFAADPLRLSNLAYGKLGVDENGQFRLTAEWHPRTGAPARILGVESVFASRLAQADNVQAALKQRSKRHLWRWPPAVVDFDLLLRYIMGPRRDRIVARRLLHDAEGRPLTAQTYSLREELAAASLALFISPDNPDRGDAHAYNGGYAGDSLLSQMVGRGMHRIVTEILGHRGVPAFAACPTTEWAGLFSGHGVRDLWGNYFAGVRGETDQGPVLADGTRVSGKQVAEDATTDEVRTLLKHYVSVSAVVRQQLLQPVESWAHPRAHDPWMDRVVRREAVDWAAERVPIPEHLEPLATAAEQRSDTPVRRARAARAGRTPASRRG